jgi:choline dehydrogenase-like flavoprotein
MILDARQIPNGTVLDADLAIIGAGEQQPNRDSRVTLSDRRDALGLPMTRLDWRLTAADKASLRRNLRALGAEFAAAGIGRLHLTLPEGDAWPEELTGGNHHMGTTRMAADPRQGVVDADCRVHGIDNLYVAGSSVFPTCGAANPTLTIVALALRLADHLRERLS